MKKMTKFSLWTILAALPAFICAHIIAAFAQESADGVVGMAKPWEIGFPVAASPMKEQMEHFHNKLLLPVIIAITIFVTLLLIYVMIRFNARTNPVPTKTTHNTMLEVIWTLVPVLILVVIVIPSMKMLYYVDRTHDAEMTLKVTGYQWYWGYEYPDNGGVNFLSNLVAEKDLKPGEPRLLKTDNAVVLPVDTNIRILTTASDVIHSFAVPSFGIKLDAVPGRTNETWVRIDKEGTFYGQCSQLCGQNHGYMPIEIHAVSKEAFATWIHEHNGKMPDEIAADKAAQDKIAADKAADDKAKAAEAQKSPDAAKERAVDVKKDAEKVPEAVNKDGIGTEKTGDK